MLVGQRYYDPSAYGRVEGTGRTGGALWSNVEDEEANPGRR